MPCMQMAAYALGQSLPEEQRPFPMDKIQINDTRSDITPNAGRAFSPAPPGCFCGQPSAWIKNMQ